MLKVHKCHGIVGPQNDKMKLMKKAWFSD